MLQSLHAAALNKATELGEALVDAAGQDRIEEVTRLLGKKADINYAHKVYYSTGGCCF